MAALVLAPTRLDGEARRALAGVWTYRARAEAQAVRRFGRLARELHSVGAGVRARLAARAAEDERRHVVLCATRAAAFGAESELPEPAPATPIGVPGLEPRDRLLYELCAFGAVTESLNAALMTATLGETRVPEVRGTVRRILADEVAHSRLGWAHLRAERAEGRGDFLAELLPGMLGATVAEELFSPAPPRELEGVLLEHGELPERMRLQIFVETLEQVIFPGLNALGVDPAAGRGWLTTALGPRL